MPELPPLVPSKNHPIARWLGKKILQGLGWRLVGTFPNQPKIMVALGPHTSNWDFIIAMAGIMATGIKASYFMKKEAFVWPFSKIWVWLGGVPLNRKATENTVEQMVQQFKQRKQLWLAITPEGTRKKVDYWKTGFVRIAHIADVPVLTVVWDYEHKELRLDKLWQVSEDYEQEAAAIRDYVRTQFKGKYPELQ